MNRKQFIQSIGATCSNWNWSWSFVNHDKGFVVFGYSDNDSNGDRFKIFSEDWEFGHDGKKKRAYSQALEHIDLIQNKGYQLKVLKLEYETIQNNKGFEVESIKSFERELHDKKLIKENRDWFAVDYIIEYEQVAEYIENNTEYLEGAITPIYVNAYERNSKARNECLKHFPYKCMICDFDFEEKYGALGREYIHVHHIIQLSKIKKEYKINPITDLIPICANCHAMIHRKREALTVDELKKMIDENIKNYRQHAI
jgi:5-methylcytosine-specific restriction protein A